MSLRDSGAKSRGKPGLPMSIVSMYTRALADGICDLKKLIQLGFIPSVGFSFPRKNRILSDPLLEYVEQRSHRMWHMT